MAWALGVGFAAPSAARAEAASNGPAVIVFGGGWGAEGTQASIEAHVEQLSRALGPKRAHVLFASGDLNVRDVQMPEREPDETGDLLGIVFDRRDNLYVDYRRSRVRAAGAATKLALLEAIDASRLEPHGTIIFGVGHGSPPSDGEQATLELWGPDDRLSVGELTRRLDGSKRASAIAFVLGQCHSGAFTAIAHVGGDSKSDLASPARCALAAVPSDREASGCTPDVNDPGARAYMSSIAEAFGKREEADLDGNGRVSLAEAHAYARVHDRTVDVPVSSSEAWILEALGPRAKKAKDLRFDRLIASARPSERLVLRTLEPSGRSVDPTRHALQKLDALRSASDRIDDEIAMLEKDLEHIRRKVLDDLLTRWPELANPYHRESRRILAGDAVEVAGFLGPRPEIAEIKDLHSTIQTKETEKLDIDREVSMIERWVRAVEIAGNEALLRKSGPKRAIEGLDRLLACENLEP